MIIIRAQTQAQAPVAPAPAAPTAQGMNFTDFQKAVEEDAPLAGSNPGGKYKHGPTGEDWYVKWDRNNRNERIQNELLAGKLYELAGVKVPELRTVNMPNGNLGLASRFVPNLKNNPDAVRAHQDMAAGFAVDAWLANWDVVGLEFDNLLHRHDTNEIYRVDTGGALNYRAMGAEKGRLFGDDAGEINTLRDPDINPQSAEMFGGISPKEINQSIQRVLAIPDDAIRNTVMTYGPGDQAKKQALAEKLIKRKNSLKNYIQPEGVQA